MSLYQSVGVFLLVPLGEILSFTVQNESEAIKLFSPLLLKCAFSLCSKFDLRGGTTGMINDITNSMEVNPVPIFSTHKVDVET